MAPQDETRKDGTRRQRYGEYSSLYRESEPIDGVSNGRNMDLVLALLSIMESKELSRIKVTEVAEEAGINRKTFYHYFHDVDDLADYIIKGVGEAYGRRFAKALIEQGNLDQFYAYKKASIEYHYLFYRELAFTHLTNVLYENIFHEWVKRALFYLEEAGADLSVRQCYALKAVTYNIMALFSEWEITDRQERGITIDELIEFFKWASMPMVSCIVENRNEWNSVKNTRSLKITGSPSLNK